MIAESAVEIRGLVKQFRGVRALDGLDLSVEPGSVFGFLGPNGAGKTTTIRILLGFARATSGSVSVFGEPVSRVQLADLGFLPDVPAYYPWLTAPELLRFVGRLHGIKGARLRSRVDTVLQLSGLADASHRVGHFSRGMKQRLGIAQALINAPKLLILDEPTSALDPMGRRDVLNMIAALKGKATVVFSTHILPDVERVCDHLGFIADGRLVASGTLEELRSRYADRTEVTLTTPAARFVDAIEDTSWASAVTAEDNRLKFRAVDPDAAARELVALLARERVGVLAWNANTVSLEDVFVSLTKGAR